MKQNHKFKADSDYKRLDVFLSKSIENISRSEISKIILDGGVKLNGTIANKKNLSIKENDVIEIIVEEKKDFSETYVQETTLEKLYEDDYIIIINKPAGILVHPGSGRREETIMDRFLIEYPQIRKIKNSDRPGIVHRLDKDTTGVLILAKDENTMKKLQDMFKHREIKKTYNAIVHGKPRFLNGTIDLPIDRDKKHKTKFTVSSSDSETARESITDYSLIESFEKLSFLALYPKTGRTHQLRVHLSHKKMPILGDKTYGLRDNEKKMYLHAAKIEFIHPFTDKEIEIICPLPEHFIKKLKNLKNTK